MTNILSRPEWVTGCRVYNLRPFDDDKEVNGSTFLFQYCSCFVLREMHKENDKKRELNILYIFWSVWSDKKLRIVGIPWHVEL